MIHDRRPTREPDGSVLRQLIRGRLLTLSITTKVIGPLCGSSFSPSRCCRTVSSRDCNQPDGIPEAPGPAGLLRRISSGSMAVRLESLEPVSPPIDHFAQSPDTTGLPAAQRNDDPRIICGACPGVAADGGPKTTARTGSAEHRRGGLKFGRASAPVRGPAAHANLE